MNETQHYDYFLVCYDVKDEKERNEDGIFHFLFKEGFISTATYWACPWVFVDIVNKKCKPGRPGVCYGRVVGDHAITFEEFKLIYEIYKKYYGTMPLTIDGVDYRYK